MIEGTNLFLVLIFNLILVWVVFKLGRIYGLRDGRAVVHQASYNSGARDTADLLKHATGGVIKMQYETIKKLEDAILEKEWTGQKWADDCSALYDSCPWCGVIEGEYHSENCIITYIRARRQMAEEL